MVEKSLEMRLANICHRSISCKEVGDLRVLDMLRKALLAEELAKISFQDYPVLEVESTLETSDSINLMVSTMVSCIPEIEEVEEETLQAALSDDEFAQNVLSQHGCSNSTFDTNYDDATEEARNENGELDRIFDGECKRALSDKQLLADAMKEATVNRAPLPSDFDKKLEAAEEELIELFLMQMGKGRNVSITPSKEIESWMYVPSCEDDPCPRVEKRLTMRHEVAHGAVINILNPSQAQEWAVRRQTWEFTQLFDSWRSKKLFILQKQLTNAQLIKQANPEMPYAISQYRKAWNALDAFRLEYSGSKALAAMFEKCYQEALRRYENEVSECFLDSDSSSPNQLDADEPNFEGGDFALWYEEGIGSMVNVQKSNEFVTHLDKVMDPMGTGIYYKPFTGVGGCSETTNPFFPLNIFLGEEDVQAGFKPSWNKYGEAECWESLLHLAGSPKEGISGIVNMNWLTRADRLFIQAKLRASFDWHKAQHKRHWAKVAAIKENMKFSKKWQEDQRILDLAEYYQDTEIALQYTYLTI